MSCYVAKAVTPTPGEIKNLLSEFGTADWQGRAVAALNPLIAAHKELSQGRKACKDPLLMGAIKLDAYITALDKSPHKTVATQEYFEHWWQAENHSARKNGTRGRLIPDIAQAKLAFLKHPEECFWMTDHFLDKQIGRHDETMGVDQEGHLSIRYNGNETRVDALMKLFQTNDHKLFRDGQRYFYTQEKGLCPCDPEKWGPTLPVFRTGDHKPTAGHWLTIKAMLGKEGIDPIKHTWMELTNPEGKTYNVGLFPEKDVDPSSLAKTVKPQFYAPDFREFTGTEELTSELLIQISEEDYEKLLAKIHDDHSKIQTFNLIDSNCSTWVAKLVEEVGIHIPSKGGVLEVYFDTVWKTDHYWAPFRFVAEKIKNLLSCARNLCLYFLGGNFWDIFNPQKGVFDHPKMIKKWIDRINAQRAKGDYSKPTGPAHVEYNF